MLSRNQAPDGTPDKGIPASACSSINEPLNTSRSTWPLTPGTDPLSVYCQNSQSFQRAGVSGQPAPQSATHSGLSAEAGLFTELFQKYRPV